MEIHQQQAYKHLTEKEKLVLSFIILNSRSFKETAAIVDISPYKIKEVYFRAKKYFLIFSEYYLGHDSLFPDNLVIDETFKNYIIRLLEHRDNPGILKKDPQFIELANAVYLRSLWKDLLETLSTTSRLHYNNLLKLILEFDKWADKRILPKAYQKPSGYDRRRLKIFKKIHEEMTGFSDMGYDLMDQLYGNKTGKGYILGFYGDYMKTIQIRLDKGSITYFTNLKVPIYEKVGLAKELGNLIINYQLRHSKTTYDASKFWANFRVLAMRALNVEEIMGIRREEFIDLSQKDREFLAKVKEKSKSSINYRTSDERLFW